VEEELIINQMNLLLTQMRSIRRALEEVERSTSRYTGFGFASALAAGPRFGQPPLFNGALKVHVVNINDLAPGSGFGGFLEGLLGGVGRLVGGLFGGFLGGTISSVALAILIPTIHALAGRIEHILQMLGLGGGSAGSGSGSGSASGTAPIGGSNLAATLESISRAVNALTGLFTAAASGPDAAARVSTFASTPAGEHWLRLLNSVNLVLNSIQRVILGLGFALPIVLGTLASFITRLSEIRVVIAETLQFLLRNLLMLRGGILVTLFDTFSFVARFAVRVLGILRDMVLGIIDAVFSMLRNVLSSVMDIVTFVGEALATTVDEVVTWLVNTIDGFLRDIGNLRVFRVVTHLVQILPAILPPLFELIRETPLDPDSIDRLERASRLPFLDVVPSAGAGTGTGTGSGTGTGTGSGTGGAPTPREFPRIDEFLDSLDFTSTLTGGIDTLERTLRGGIDDTLGTAQSGLIQFGAALDAATAAELSLSSSTLDAHLGQVRQHSSDLASALIVPERTSTRTGVEDVARAYESWLTGGGFDTLLGTITAHFASPEGAAGIPSRIADGAIDRPRATVEIQELIIEVDAPAVESPPPLRLDDPPLRELPDVPRSDDAVRYARAMREYELRGGSIEDLFDRASEVT
jgi:hypothetical protein